MTKRYITSSRSRSSVPYRLCCFSVSSHCMEATGTTSNAAWVPVHVCAHGVTSAHRPWCSYLPSPSSYLPQRHRHQPLVSDVVPGFGPEHHVVQPGLHRRINAGTLRDIWGENELLASYPRRLYLLFPALPVRDPSEALAHLSSAPRHSRPLLGPPPTPMHPPPPT